jgi:hypothetical protein
LLGICGCDLSILIFCEGKVFPSPTVDRLPIDFYAYMQHSPTIAKHREAVIRLIVLPIFEWKEERGSLGADRSERNSELRLAK